MFIKLLPRERYSRTARHSRRSRGGPARRGSRCYEWGELLSDVPVASAILDRLLHHAEVLAISGRSYRFQDSADQRTLYRPKSSPKHQRFPARLATPNRRV